MTPQVTISGVIHSVEVLEKVTIVNIAAERKSRDGVETKIYPVKWFKERAAKFASVDLRGRAMIAACDLSSREHQGKYYLDLLGVDYGFHGTGQASAPPPPPPTPMDDGISDTPF